MMQKLEIYRSAKALLQKYGQTAYKAALRANSFLAAGDIDGLKIWKDILKVMDDLSITSATGRTIQ